MNDKNDDYIVYFKGAKLSKRNANKVGLTLIFGFIGAIIAAYTTQNKTIGYVIVFLFILVGCFLSNKIFNKKT